MRTCLRIAAGAATAALAGTVLAGPAHADEGDLTPLRDHALSAAVAAADSHEGRGLVREAAHATTTPSVADHGVAVYGLSADFVRGTSQVPGEFWYVATNASVGDQRVTVFTIRDDDGWAPVNVATGRTEARMARRAGDASLLVEPQVSAWYAVADGQVRPLNDAARGVVGEHAVALTAYQHIVEARYGAMLPGSAYDESGTAGGYGDTPAGAAAGVVASGLGADAR